MYMYVQYRLKNTTSINLTNVQIIINCPQGTFKEPIKAGTNAVTEFRYSSLLCQNILNANSIRATVQYMLRLTLAYHPQILLLKDHLYSYVHTQSISS